MENSKKDFKKWIILILIAVVGYWTINNLNTVRSAFSNISNIIFPFVLGACLAFILNMPMTFFEKKLLKIKNRKNKKIQKSNTKHKKLIRIISIIFAITSIVLILILIVNLIVPELINIVNLLIDNIPYYAEEITKLIEMHQEEIPDINTVIEETNIDVEGIKNELINKIPGLVTSSISIVKSIISGIASFLISIVFAIYILMDKENLKRQVAKMLYAYLNKDQATKIINVGRVSKNTFKNFFTVQCLEAIILGTLCIIGMLILKIPYAVPIGVLIGVTALIPIVGAFLGAIVGSILIVSVAPIKVITFLIFIVVLQQIEGNLIYPRVVGNSVGLPGMWVLVAVSVGGKLGGVLGMLLGVPIATIIYTLLRRNVDKKISEKEEIESIFLENK